MQATTTRPKIIITADGDGVVPHVGSRLLADVADRTTLTADLSQVLGGLRRPRTRHDPGRVLVDMAVAVADGASTISDVAVLAGLRLGLGELAVEEQRLGPGEEVDCEHRRRQPRGVDRESRDGKWPSPVSLPVRIRSSTRA